MHEKLIPEHIDPFRFAEQSLKLSGSVKLADMHRLAPQTARSDGAVVVDLAFGVDEQGITYLKGHLEVTLSLTCQRCLEPFSYGIISDFMIGIVRSLDEADALPARYEPALVEEGHLALRELIEDEVILNLPIIPRHEQADCLIHQPVTTPEWEEANQTSPFQALRVLKSKK